MGETCSSGVSDVNETFVLSSMDKKYRGLFSFVARQRGVAIIGFALVSGLLFATVLMILAIARMFVAEGVVKERLNQMLRYAEGQVDLWPRDPLGTDALTFQDSLDEINNLFKSRGTSIMGMDLKELKVKGLNGEVKTVSFAFLPPGFCAEIVDKDDPYWNGKTICNSHLCGDPLKATNSCKMTVCNTKTNLTEEIGCSSWPLADREWGSCEKDESGSPKKMLCAHPDDRKSYHHQLRNFPVELKALMDIPTVVGTIKREIAVAGFPRIMVKEEVASVPPPPICPGTWVRHEDCQIPPGCGLQVGHGRVSYTCSTGKDEDCWCVTKPGDDGKETTCSADNPYTGRWIPDTCNTCIFPATAADPADLCQGEQTCGWKCGDAVDPNCCDERNKPDPVVRECERTGGQWRPGEWGQCVTVTGQCGTGEKKRSYSCTQDICCTEKPKDEVSTCEQPCCNPWVPVDTCPPSIPCGTTQSKTRTWICPTGNCCLPKPADQNLHDNACPGEPCTSECIYQLKGKIGRNVDWKFTYDANDVTSSAFKACASAPVAASCEWYGGTSDTANRPDIQCSASTCAILADMTGKKFSQAEINQYNKDLNAGCNNCTNCSLGTCYHLGGGNKTFSCGGTILGCSAQSVLMSCQFDETCCQTEKSLGYYSIDASGQCVKYSGSTDGKKICTIEEGFKPGTPISLLINDAKLEDIKPASVTFALTRKYSGKYTDWYASSVSPLLVFDPEHKGQIISAEQLFGNLTFGGKAAGKILKEWDSGYDALATLDLNKDGVLKGLEIAALGLWFDNNQDAVSQPGEVKALADTGIVEVYVRGTRTDERNKAIYAEPGYKILEDGIEKIGVSVDWRAAMYQSVHSASSVSWRASLVTSSVAVTKPPALGQSVAAKVVANQINIADFAGSWDYKVLGLPKGESPIGNISFDIDPDTGFVLGYSQFDLHFVGPEGEKVVEKKAATLQGQVTNGLMTFKLHSSKGRPTYSTVALGKDGKSLYGTSVTTIRNLSGGDTRVEYDWVATRIKTPY